MKLSDELKHCLDGSGCGNCEHHEADTKFICRGLLEKAYERIKGYEDMEDWKNGDMSRWVFPETATKCIEYMQAYINSEKPRKLESEEKPMLHNVTVTKTEEKALEEYYVMRAVKNSNFAPNKTKQVFKEKECNQQPTLEEIAQFLSDTGADFVSVEHNYRFELDLPFC